MKKLVAFLLIISIVTGLFSQPTLVLKNNCPTAKCRFFIHDGNKKSVYDVPPNSQSSKINLKQNLWYKVNWYLIDGSGHPMKNPLVGNIITIIKEWYWIDANQCDFFSGAKALVTIPNYLMTFPRA